MSIKTDNIPQIPTSVLLTEVYGELGNDLGWSLERTKFHTDLSIIGSGSDDIKIGSYAMELEILIKNNPTSLLTDLHERRAKLKIDFLNSRNLFLRLLHMKVNLEKIDGAMYKDMTNSTLYTGIVYLLDNGKICDSYSVDKLNTMILNNEKIKDLCRKLLLDYAKLIIVTDVLVKCIMMAKITEQVPEEI